MIEETKKYYAWHEALELSRSVVAICEEFSDAETNVLVWHLRQAIVDIPVGIARDLAADRPANLEAILKLATELELVTKIYPAIDTEAVSAKAAGLAERMRSTKFAETEPEPEEEHDLTPIDSSISEPATTVDQVASPQSQPAGGTIVAPQVDQVTGPVTVVSPAEGS